MSTIRPVKKILLNSLVSSLVGITVMTFQFNAFKSKAWMMKYGSVIKNQFYAQGLLMPSDNYSFK